MTLKTTIIIIILYDSSLVVAGDIDQSSLLSKINFLSWKSKEVFIPSSFDFPETNETTIYLLDKEALPNHLFFLGTSTDKYDVDGDYLSHK